MLIDVFLLLARNVSPEVVRLRRISVFFFLLWIFNLVLGLYCKCLVINLNASLVLNHHLSLLGAVLTRTLQLAANDTFPSTIPGYERKLFSQTQFCFVIERLPTLISFASIVFLLFVCTMVIGDSLHHRLHAHETCPVIMVTTSIVNLVSVTVYAKEIDLYDRLCGQKIEHEVHSLTFGQIFRNFRQCGGISILFLKVSKLLKRFVRRAFAPLTVLLVCLLVEVFRVKFLHFISAILLTVYVFALSIKKANKMICLLVNGAVRDPSRVAACELAIRKVKRVDGVLQLLSSVFWEVSEGEVMALLRIRIMSAANPATVTMASRKILEGVATYVFVEIYDPLENVRDIDERKYHSHSACSDHHHHHHTQGYNCKAELTAGALFEESRMDMSHTHPYAHYKEPMTSHSVIYPRPLDCVASHTFTQEAEVSPGSG